MIIGEETAEALREWAKGHKPTMAAVDFLLMCDAVPGRYLRKSEGPVTAWLDLDRMASDLAEGELGSLSGGEYATVRLAASMYNGEIDDFYWRLDGQRKQAFVQALARNA